MISGGFTEAGGLVRHGVARLSSDDSVDATFDMGWMGGGAPQEGPPLPPSPTDRPGWGEVRGCVYLFLYL